MDNLYHLDKVFFGAPLHYGVLYLLQIGRMFCKPDTLIGAHIHYDLFELTIVTGGEAVISTNGVETPVQKGDIYLSYPGDIHEIRSSRSAPLKYDFFAFQLHDDELKTDFEKIAQDYASPSTRVFHDDRIRSLIGNAIAEIDNDGYYSHELLCSVFKAIMIYVIRGFKQIRPSKDLSNSTRTELLCYRVMNYIDTHIYSLKSLFELEDVLGYSYGYLSSVFKKTTGQNLSDYFKDRRLDAARLLLIENRLSITEISELLGYSSVYAFSKAYKDFLGISPKQFRNEQNTK